MIAIIRCITRIWCFLFADGSDEWSELATSSSLSQVEDLGLINEIQLLDSSSSLQSSAPSSKKNDIQKQTTTTNWDSPEAKKRFNLLLKV